MQLQPKENKIQAQQVSQEKPIYLKQSSDKKASASSSQYFTRGTIAPPHQHLSVWCISFFSRFAQAANAAGFRFWTHGGPSFVCWLVSNLTVAASRARRVGRRSRSRIRMICSIMFCSRTVIAAQKTARLITTMRWLRRAKKSSLRSRPRASPTGPCTEQSRSKTWLIRICSKRRRSSSRWCRRCFRPPRTSKSTCRSQSSYLRNKMHRPDSSQGRMRKRMTIWRVWRAWLKSSWKFTRKSSKTSRKTENLSRTTRNWSSRSGISRARTWRRKIWQSSRTPQDRRKSLPHRKRLRRWTTRPRNRKSRRSMSRKTRTKWPTWICKT